MDSEQANRIVNAFLPSAGVDTEIREDKNYPTDEVKYHRNGWNMFWGMVKYRFTILHKLKLLFLKP